MQRLRGVPVRSLVAAAVTVAVMTGAASLRGQTVAQPALAVPIAAGDTVQVEAPPGIPFLVRARIVELRPSAIVIRINNAADTVVPFAEVKWLAVRRGTRGHPIAGALIGLVAGAVVGGAISKPKSLGSTISKSTLIVSASGAVAGFIAGGLIRADRWVPVIEGPSPVQDYGMLDPNVRYYRSSILERGVDE